MDFIAEAFDAYMEHEARQQGIDLDELSFMELTQAVYQGLQALGAKIIQRRLAAKDQRLHQQGVVCTHEDCAEAGQPMRRTARRTGQVTTVFGEVTYRRGEYEGRCGHRRRPVDEAWDLRPGQPDPYLEGLLAEVGAQTSFERGAEWVVRWFHVEVSPNTVRRATVDWGERLAQEERAQYEASAEQAGPKAPGPKRVYGAIDGGLVPARKGENGEEGWREAKMVAWFQEGKPYSGPKEEGKDPTKPRAVEVKLAGTLGAKDVFGEVLWTSGEAYGADRAEEVVILGDGAAWIWDVVKTYFPRAVEILDWSHAVGRLHPVRRGRWKEDDPAGWWAWVKAMEAALWGGDVDTVVQGCEALAQGGGEGVEEAARAAGYFERHRVRMRYRDFREAGYFIGSGVKQVVRGRMKVAGAQWKMKSGEAVLKARCVWLNGDSALRLPLAT